MMGGMQNMMKQAQKLQKEIMKMQEELANKEYEATSGGDMVQVKINGNFEFKHLKIAKEVIDPDDIEMLEDLILAASNEAIKKVKDDQSNNMSNLTGGMKIPGFNA